ncbi:MAG: hypothetical protein PHE83_05130 [Opitutaceae bacterium]|nr:hypothetical protein [Opitutaceae bacterium]
MPYTFFGIGTKFYGKRDFRDDGTYITTEWFVFFYVPLQPLRSLRLKFQGADEPKWQFPLISFTSHYVVHQPDLPFDWRQVLYTYAYVALLFVWCVFVGQAIMAALPKSTDNTLAGVLLISALLIPAPIPWIFRRLALKRRRP